jgi:hypothetical protein
MAFGIVPIADGRRCAKQSFSGAIGIEKPIDDSLIELPTATRVRSSAQTEQPPQTQ